MVIEAVFEDINIKHKVIKEVEAVSNFMSLCPVLNQERFFTSWDCRKMIRPTSSFKLGLI